MLRSSIFFLLLCSVSQAGTVDFPHLIAGPVVGNDNEAAVSEIVGHEVKQVGKIELEGDENAFTFNIEGTSNTLTLLDQGVSFFFSSGVVKGTVTGNDWDYLAVKSGPNFFLYKRTGDLTYFETDCHFLSHVSLYRSVPEPGSGLLLGLALLILRRKQWTTQT